MFRLTVESSACPPAVETSACPAVDETSDDKIVVRRRTDTSKKPSLLERRRTAGSRFSSGSGTSWTTSLDCDSINLEERARQQACGLSLEQNYGLEEQLGRGSFSSVWKAKRRATGEDVCLKIQGMPSSDPELAMLWQNEYGILQEVQDHRYIIRALDFFLCPMHGCVLVLEHVGEAVTLQDAVSASSDAAGKHSLSEASARWAVGCLLEAVAHLHQLHILHRDIKAENVLVRADPVTGDLRDLRVIDFNTARKTTTSQCLTLTGTPDYLAPEVLLGSSHTELSDAWAVGVCLYLMVAGVLPWKRDSYASHREFGLALMNRSCDASASLQGALRGEGAREALTPILLRKQLERLSAESRSLLGRLLEADPAARATVAEMCGREWMKGV